MEHLVVVMLGGLLAGGAVALLRWHRRQWLKAKAEYASDSPADREERGFHRGQFRRRVQMSALLALLGIGMALSPLASPDAAPAAFVCLWLGLAVATCWVAALALVDLLAINRYAAQLNQRMASQQQALRAELGPRDLSSHPQQNGHP